MEVRAPNCRVGGGLSLSRKRDIWRLRRLPPSCRPKRAGGRGLCSRPRRLHQRSGVHGGLRRRILLAVACEHDAAYLVPRREDHEGRVAVLAFWHTASNFSRRSIT